MAKLVGKNPYEWFKIRPGKPKKNRSSGSTDRNYFRFLLKNINKTHQSFGKFGGKNAYFRSQNSLVKSSYLRNKYPNQWAAHGRYLQRKGAQREDEIGLGFNAERDDIQIAKELNLWQNSGVAQLAVLANMESIKGTILDPTHKESIWENASLTEVRLKPDLELNKADVRDLAKGDFDNIWTMIKQAQVGDERMWKIILSPEAGDKVNLKEHAITFMENVEKDLGRKLTWVAIDHYNTDQYHLHFCIRGVDKNGQEFRIDKDYVKEGARKISKQLLTEKLGVRTDEYILERRGKSIQLKHVTELDRIIERDLNSDHFINIKHGSDSSVDQAKRLQIMARLEFLEFLGLAKKHDSVSWYVEPTFINYLKYIQEQNDVIKLLNKHRDNIINQDLPLVVDKLPEVGDRVIGRVIGTGLNERNEDLRYIFVEGIDGQNHYITAPTKILKLRDNHQLFNGDIVYLERSEFAKNDKKISYIKADAYTDFEEVRLSPDVINIDRFIMDKLIQDGHVPEIKLTDNAVRQEFLKVVHHRINYLRSRDILDDNLEVNLENLKRHMGRHL